MNKPQEEADACERQGHKVFLKMKDGYKWYECHDCGVVYHESGVEILWGTTKLDYDR